MLSWTCRRFRARFTPGSTHLHRRSCPECEAYAAALERSAGSRLPVPSALGDRLRGIARPEAGAVLPFPIPPRQVPDALAARLRAIAPPGRPAPPEWLRDSRYAVAASALLALLLGPFFASGAGRGLEALGAVRDGVAPILQQTREEGREEIDKVRSGASEAYAAARRTLARSAESLSGLTERLSLSLPETFNEPDPEGEPAGSSRRR